MEIQFGKRGEGSNPLLERCYIYNRCRYGMSARSRITGEGVAAGALLLIVAGVGALMFVVLMLLL